MSALVRCAHASLGRPSPLLEEMGSLRPREGVDGPVLDPSPSTSDHCPKTRNSADSEKPCLKSPDELNTALAIELLAKTLELKAPHLMSTYKNKWIKEHICLSVCLSGNSSGNHSLKHLLL
jgi:hypothetical protein